MCGIAGIINLDQLKRISSNALRRMVSIQQHRGPDESGGYIDDNIGLAHSRLSIIDLSEGTQPIHNEDKSLWIIYNGEVFNYPELRQELVSRGHKFYTTSDTEVILHLYEEKGINCLNELNGQFAFAIWNSHNKSLFLSRDRVGILPSLPVSQSLPTSPPPTLRPVPADALVIENGTVIDGTGAASLPDGVVVIQGDRIAAVGPRADFAIPTSVQVVDGMGGTILPGIINAHVHGTSSAAVRRVYFLLKGVTSVCDMGSPLSQMPQFAQDHTAGPAARGFKNGPIVTVRGGYPDIVWHADLNYEVATPDETRAAVADLARRGADVIKIALEPGSAEDPWPMLDLQQVQAIVQEAHARGKLVRAHVGRTNGTDVLDIVLKSGVDVIDHVPLPVFSAREIYGLIQDSGHYTMTSADKDQLARALPVSAHAAAEVCRARLLPDSRGRSRRPAGRHAAAGARHVAH